MPEVLTVEQARDKIVELAVKEKDTDFRNRTKITVKGEISAVDPPRNDGKYQDIYLMQETPAKPLFLQISRFDLQGRDGQPWNKPLTEADIGSEQTFTGTAHEYKGQLSLSAMLGDGSRQRSGGGRYDDPPGRQRRIAGGMILNGNFARGLSTAEAIAEVTPERITDFLERCKEPASKKPEAKTEEPEEATGPDDPFEG